MTVGQHAEALVKYLKENLVPEGLSESEQHAVVVGIIAKHMQSAVDEATAPLKARIAALEGLGPLIERFASAEIDVVNGLDGSLSRAMELSKQIKAILNGGAW